MSSTQIWLYVIIGIVYAVSRLLKKPKQQAGLPKEQQSNANRERQVQPAPVPQKGLTFEELLREITEGKAMPKAEPVVDYDDELGEEEKDLEDVDYNYRKDSQVYEDAKKQAFFRPSLEETMNVKDTVVSFGKFKEFERVKERNLSEEYLNHFLDQDAIKKAVVMSEILKTKF